MALDQRQRTYFAVRGGAALVFVGAAVLLPSGPFAALLCVAAGVAAVMACIGVNAGGPGERAGTLPQERRLGQLRFPQGDWPPYAPETVVDGEVVRER